MNDLTEVIGAGGIGLAIARRISHGQHKCLGSRWAGCTRLEAQVYGIPGRAADDR